MTFHITRSLTIARLYGRAQQHEQEAVTVVVGAAILPTLLKMTIVCLVMKKKQQDTRPLTCTSCTRSWRSARMSVSVRLATSQ